MPVITGKAKELRITEWGGGSNAIQDIYLKQSAILDEMVIVKHKFWREVAKVLKSREGDRPTQLYSKKTRIERR